MDTPLERIGLMVYLISVALQGAALAIDVGLAKTHGWTITDICRAHHWVAWLIIVACVVGLVGLALHLLGAAHAE
jgi:hypothetical protein